MSPRMAGISAVRFAPACFCLTLAAAQAAPRETVLYNFDVLPAGFHPQAALTPGPGGVYYGTADDGGATGSGVVFALVPDAAAKSGWAEKILYAFSGASDGAQPSSGLKLGADGVLYGVTGAGGAYGAGVVFSLTPPANGQTGWTEATLYTFHGKGDGRAPFGTLVQGADGTLYGSTAGGGDKQSNGVVFSLTPPAGGGADWTETVLHHFKGGNDGLSPSAGLLLDPSGALFGMTSSGGTAGAGTAYRLDPPQDGGAAWRKTTLYDFTGQADGGFPVGALVEGQNGTLYGVANFGGTAYFGVAFSLTPPAKGRAWSETVLYNFTGGADGGSPDATPVLGGDGTLYGVTDGGGPAGSGVAFALTPPASGQGTWTDTTLASFDGQNGAGPAGIGMGPGDTLIGTTFDGGNPRRGGGTIFQLTPPAKQGQAWTQAVLHRFRETGEDPVSPTGALLLGNSGTLYGTSNAGGERNDGTVFALTPPGAGETAWQRTVLYSFHGRDGDFPTGKLVQDRNGVLYGMTASGGPQGSGNGGNGTVFALTPPASGQTAWTETLLHQFQGVATGDGAFPQSGLIMDAAGTLYGTTGYGGTATSGDTIGNGIVFKLSPPAHGQAKWKETVLYRFSGPDGATPAGALLMGKTGTLYGTTYVGGAAGEGTVFSLTPPAGSGTVWTEAVLHSFNVASGNDGAIPGAEQLLEDANGALYGTTSQGGAGNDGTVFMLAPPSGGGDWSETIIHAFSGSDGIAPFVGLLAGGRGRLYGVAEQGGDESLCQSPFGGGCGTVFRLTPGTGSGWAFKVLHSFKPAYGQDGGDPAGALIKGANGVLYGTTAGGGFGGAGTAFAVSP